MNRGIAAVVIAAAGVLSAACRTQSPLPVSEAARTEMDYAVYSAALDGAFGEPLMSDSGKPARFVLRDSTVASGIVTAGLKTEYMRRQFGMLESEYNSTLDSFIARNSKPVALDPSALKTRGTVELVARKDLPVDPAVAARPDSPNDYWRQYYTLFPRARGLLGFSRPGYDESRKHALLYFGHGCGWLCAEYGYLLMERRNGSWIVLRKVVTMVS